MKNTLMPQTANTIMQFLQRVTLSPNEIPAYQQCVAELNVLAQPPAPVENITGDAAPDHGERDLDVPETGLAEGGETQPAA